MLLASDSPNVASLRGRADEEPDPQSYAVQQNSVSPASKRPPHEGLFIVCDDSDGTFGQRVRIDFLLPPPLPQSKKAPKLNIMRDVTLEAQQKRTATISSMKNPKIVTCKSAFV